MYRALKSLHRAEGKIIEVGKPTMLEWLTEAQIAKLIERGCVAKLHPPPLAELPGWKTRAKKLESQGITDAAQLLMCDDAKLAKALRVQLAMAKKLKQDVEGWLTVEPKKSR